MESEYLKEIKENLWNIGEDMACDIINAYYRDCKRKDVDCVDCEGNYIFNLMDTKQSIDAVHYGFAQVAEAFCKKPDWILVVRYDKETDKPIFTTEGPSTVLESCLKNIVCSYICDPMAYPAFFREAVSEPLLHIVALNL